MNSDRPGGDDWRATFEQVSIDQLLAFARASHDEKFQALTAMYEVYVAAQTRLSAQCVSDSA